MVLFARLELKQSQRLVITPQLQQAIKLLQLSALELQTYIENEVRENPFLSLEETADAAQAGEGEPRADAPSDISGDVPAFDARETSASKQNDSWDAEFDSDGDRSHPAAGPAAAADGADWRVSDHPAGSRGQSEDYDPLATLAPEISLSGHLSEQAQLAFAGVQERFIAEYLIDLVDADGYIRSPLEDAAATLGASMSEIERIVAVLQTFDPPGICARSLAECLALQLKEKNRYDPYMERLLGNLHLLAATDFQRLKKVCGVDADDLEEMIAEIRQLNPRPGSGFEKATVETLVPDVIVRRGRDGTWRAELNPAAAPSLAVDRAYYAALKARCRSDADKTYLSDRLSAANWLAKSLEQRLSTILKVANAVVEEQAAFFDKGVRYLKPLNLRQIAVKIGMHESTVSRVTSNKAMATPRGLLEMKYFFTSAIAAAGSASQAHSSEAVRDRIKELISNEQPDQILSDDRIVALLKTDGIEIARRTVAKYREALRIPSSAARRRQKRVLSAA